MPGFDIVVYHQEFRSVLFISGFTLGTFLLSMKSLIIKTVKDEYYDTNEYQEDVRQRRKLGQKTGYYNQLRNFSKLLFASIVIAFLGAFVQITIGYIGEIWASWVCVCTSILTWIMVGLSIYLMSNNWTYVIDLSEKRAIVNENKVSEGNGEISGSKSEK